MKCEWLMAAVVAFLTVLSAAGQVPMALSSLKTSMGTEYQRVTITEAGVDGVSLVHANGLARLAWKEVPGDIRERLGWSDERIAKVAEAKAFIAKVKAAEKAAVEARTRLMKRRIKPLDLAVKVTAESETGSRGMHEGKDAFLLGVVGHQPGEVVQGTGWKDGFIKMDGKPVLQIVLDKAVEPPGYGEAVALIQNDGGDAGSMEVKIGAVETIQARDRLRARNLPTTVLQFAVSEVVYNGVLGKSSDGKAVYVIGVTGLTKEQNSTVTAWPDGMRTVGGVSYQVWVTTGP